MTVKSDRWIREKSILPTFILTSRWPLAGEHGTRIVESASHLSAAELDTVIQKASELHLGTTPVWPQPISYRELTVEEENNFKPLISPFVKQKTSHLENGKRVPSFGLSSYGYDIRLGRDFKLFNRPQPGQSWGMPEIDICNVLASDAGSMYNTDSFVMPPHSFCLSVSMERIVVPSNCIVICMAKSTVSRGGLLAVVTPLEPGWEGYVTLELYNSTDSPMKLTAGMGIMQMIWLESDERCERDYAQMGGKYQNQAATPVMPI